MNKIGLKLLIKDLNLLQFNDNVWSIVLNLVKNLTKHGRNYLAIINVIALGYTKLEVLLDQVSLLVKQNYKFT